MANDYGEEAGGDKLTKEKHAFRGARKRGEGARRLRRGRRGSAGSNRRRQAMRVKTWGEDV